MPRPRSTRPPARPRGPLQPMRSSPSFLDFVLDQLAGLPALRARAMFGGIGLYADDVFFGLIAADVLYLKVDDSNRPRFERAGSRAFQPYAGQATTMPYYNVPVEVLEDAPELVVWARRSIDVAERARAVRAARPGRRHGRSAGRAT